jgi:hypothetical protein
MAVIAQVSAEAQALFSRVESVLRAGDNAAALGQVPTLEHPPTCVQPSCVQTPSTPSSPSSCPHAIVMAAAPCLGQPAAGSVGAPLFCSS